MKVEVTISSRSRPPALSAAKWRGCRYVGQLSLAKRPAAELDCEQLCVLLVQGDTHLQPA